MDYGRTRRLDAIVVLKLERAGTRLCVKDAAPEKDEDTGVRAHAKTSIAWDNVAYA